MDLSSILDRFTGKNFILYGGDNSTLELLSSKGTVLLWYTNKYDETTTPKQQYYYKIADLVLDAIYVIIGTGYVGKTKAESITHTILRNPINREKTVIFHGYPDFVSSYDGSTYSKYTYATGCIVTPINDKVTYLTELINVLNSPIQLPIPLRDSDIPVELVQYIHLLDRIKKLKEQDGIVSIPITDGKPTDIINIDNPAKWMEYMPSSKTSAIHWGQRKLLISEIELLIAVLSRDILNGGNGMDFIIVYVGSAPGSHLIHLLNLFSSMYRMTVHLWDRPSRFDIQESSIIRIVPSEFADPAMTGDMEGFFTDIVASNYLRTYGTNNRIIFISDIRDSASEDAISNDMNMQRKWVETLQPYASQLKFRLPFSGDIGYTYLSGEIYTQTWARSNSTETRLLSYRPYQTKVYNREHYEQSLSYFNNITRVSSYDMGIASGSKNVSRYIPMVNIGLCTCHDCAREIQVIGKYLSFVGAPIDEPTISSIVILNTEASRPRDNVTNKRTLWNKVSTKAPPSDRSNLVLYKELPDNHEDLSLKINTLWKNKTDSPIPIRLRDTTLDNINIVYTSNILIYGDDLTPEQIVDLFMAKSTTGSIIDSKDTPLSLMRDVLTGSRYNLVINFHTDFTAKYDPSRDLGANGRMQYGLFLRNRAISDQTSLISNIDLWGHLLLYIISRMI